MTELMFLESFRRMPLLTLPVRSVVLPLQSARLLISPGSCLEESKLLEAGLVTDLVAPSLLHGAGIPKASRLFPSAKIWRPADLAEKSWPFGAELPLIALEGMPSIQEFLFVHKATRTLIVTDFLFNLTNPKGLGAWIILNLFGTYKRLGISSFFLRGVKDREAFERSLGRLMAHDFDRIVVSHGDIVPQGGRQLLLGELERRGLTPRA